MLPKEKLERQVLDALKSKVLTDDNIEKLVMFSNAELDSTSMGLRDRLDAIDAELGDVKARLSRLYDALETGKIELDDLSPRIKELKSLQDDLSKTRVQLEVDMIAQGFEPLDAATIKAYAQDMRSLLGDVDLTMSKFILRSFVKRISIKGSRAKIQYSIPMPPDGKRTQWVEVLPIDTPGGAGGIRTPYLLTASQTFSQVNYGPTNVLLI
jgi:site-specific DNA recombinase